MHEKHTPQLRALIAEAAQELKKAAAVAAPVDSLEDKSNPGYNLYRGSRPVVNPTNANKQYYDVEFTQKTYYTD